MATLQHLISPQSRDIIDRAIRDTSLIPDFLAAADLIYRTPAGPYLAVSNAIDAALSEWADDNNLLAAAVSAEQRDHITAELLAACWKEADENPAILPVDPAFDALQQHNDWRRGMAA